VAVCHTHGSGSGTSAPENATTKEMKNIQVDHGEYCITKRPFIKKIYNYCVTTEQCIIIIENIEEACCMEKEKILIVSVNEYDIDSVNSLNEKYQIFTAPSLEDALRKFKDERFHTAVTAIYNKFPGRVEMVRKLQQVNAEIPFLVITFHNSVLIALEVMNVTMNDYIAKSFNLDEPKLVVMHALDRKKIKKKIRDKKHLQDSLFVDGFIYNRRFFDELLQHEEQHAKRHPHKFTLLILNIDDFETFNLCYGPKGEDDVLDFVAAILKSRVRSADSVSRFGPEEFAVITPHTERKSALVLASRILEAVSGEQLTIEGSKAGVTVSIGMSTFNEDAFTKEALIKTAEEALSQAKKLGKNRVCLFGST
jgi:diguanylate cyclase (GGDEF)-like protein